MVCNPFCCSSIRRGAKRIAIIDIVLFFLTVFISVGLEWSLFKSIPMKLHLFDDGTSGEVEETTDLEPETMHMVGKAVWIHITHAIKNSTEISSSLGYLVYMSLLIGMMGYFILEIWLCCILVRAAQEKRRDFCNRWLFYRTGLLILTLTMTGINLLQMQYTVTDICFQPLNILRIYSIFAVFQLRKKLLKMDPKLVY